MGLLEPVCFDIRDLLTGFKEPVMACLFLYKGVPDCIKRVSKCLSIFLYTVLAAPFQM